MTPIELRNQSVAIEEDIRLAVLSFAAIARKHNVSIADVNTVWEFMCECEE